MDFNVVATSQNLDPEEAENFNLPELQKYFLWLSHFQKQGYNKKSVMKGLEAKDIAQWEDTHYKAGYNSEKLVAEDLHKSYSANH
ncbi:hypothetical protein C1645_819468 [Glomus cerebriforme]|uniref:Uncharacterized protein n=1 Tax=Glomus cerebriforme TaxID=658196 RepID=A0A397TAV3_9GLOM|nr:hypothetical protein C1645_819468 [Glomus cerebriforme]